MSDTNENHTFITYSKKPYSCIPSDKNNEEDISYYHYKEL